MFAIIYTCIYNLTFFSTFFTTTPYFPCDGQIRQDLENMTVGIAHFLNEVATAYVRLLLLEVRDINALKVILNNFSYIGYIIAFYERYTAWGL